MHTFFIQLVQCTFKGKRRNVPVTVVTAITAPLKLHYHYSGYDHYSRVTRVAMTSNYSSITDQHQVNVENCFTWTAKCIKKIQKKIEKIQNIHPFKCQAIKANGGYIYRLKEWHFKGYKELKLSAAQHDLKD